MYTHLVPFSSTPPGVHNYTLRYRSVEKQTRRMSQRYVVPKLHGDGEGFARHLRFFALSVYVSGVQALFCVYGADY